MSPRLILMDHDGAIDDFLAMMLLMTMDHLQPLGIVVTPADCYIEAAVSVTRKLLDWLKKENIPVAQSTVRGINPFPREYRRDCLIIDNFPILNQRDTLKTPLVSESGQDFIVNTLNHAAHRVTLMVTGPLTTVATALDTNPQIIDKIEEIVWMGGALTVAGNVEREFAPEQDGSAEWNVFWDPLAAKRVWETEIPLTLCPLDLTNTVPITREFLRQLAKQRHHALSDFAGLCYALATPQIHYCCWDVLATAYLGNPQLYTLQDWETDIITTGKSVGKTQVVSGGRKISVMQTVDHNGFYDYLLTQWGKW